MRAGSRLRSWTRAMGGETRHASSNLAKLLDARRGARRCRDARGGSARGVRAGGPSRQPDRGGVQPGAADHALHRAGRRAGRGDAADQVVGATVRLVRLAHRRAGDVRLAASAPALRPDDRAPADDDRRRGDRGAPAVPLHLPGRGERRRTGMHGDGTANAGAPCRGCRNDLDAGGDKAGGRAGTGHQY